MRGRNPQGQSGIGLIELMLGIAVSLILLTGVLTLMLRITTAGAESVSDTRLNQQLRSSLDFMVKELQRAGYVAWYQAWDDDNGDGDPVDTNDQNSQSGTLVDSNGDGSVDIMDYYLEVLPALDRMGSVTLWSFPTAGVAGVPAACTTDCDCVLYSYDLNEDGAQGIGSGATGANQNTANFELFGLRFNDGAIEMRTAGNTHDCNSGTWQDISDSAVDITSLTFAMTFANSVGTGNDSTVYTIDEGGGYTMAVACTPSVSGTYPGDDATADTLCLWRRKIAITVQATPSGDATASITLNTDVKLKNDFLDSQ